MFARRPIALAVLLLAACAATVEDDWQPVEREPFVTGDGAFSLVLPEGWKRSGQTITRDGPDVQTITFNSGAVMEPGTAPLDLAEPQLLQALQDQLSVQAGVKVIECGAARLDGLPAFRMHFVQQALSADDSPEGVARPTSEIVLYGAIEGPTLYALSYESLDRTRFADDLPVFERLVESFRRAPATKP